MHLTMPSWPIWLFWACSIAIAYPFAIYPLILLTTNRIAGRSLRGSDAAYEPPVTVICPVHNEAGTIGVKIRNLLALDYPREKMQILVVGDGCTDRTLDIAEQAGSGHVVIVPLQTRSGKAAALNAGLARASGEIVVFTDASIRTEPAAMRWLAAHFIDPAVGCVSGEDHIEGVSAEGAYGRIELLLRREEAKFDSIAGASGCLYAMRRSLCQPFKSGMAPDFLSVLDTVRAGFLASCEPRARGVMTATGVQRAELGRKTRTFLRGITTLFANAGMMNPLRYPAFSFILVSHKLLRWMTPMFLLGCAVSAFLLREYSFYLIALQLQILMYAVAAAGLAFPSFALRSTLVRLCAFFLLINVAAAGALASWLVGVRREVWEPTRRPT